MKTLLRILLVAVIFVLGISVGMVLGAEYHALLPAISTPTIVPETPTGEATITPASTPATLKDAFGIVWEAWGVLQKDFYGNLPSPREAAYDAVRGIVSSLGDPFTNFFTPEEAKQFTEDMSGHFEGIGAVVRQAKGGGILVVKPFKDSPAWKAGIRRGDVIIAVDGKDITHLSLEEAIMLVRGPAGSKVTLTIVRKVGEKPLDVEVVRSRIEIPTVESKMLPNDIAYLRLTSFTENSPKLVRDDLKSLLKRHPKGLVFDLRGNGGGYLDAGITIGSEFIKSGDILIEKFKDGREKHYKAESGGTALDIPLVVLVDGGTASASEIVAGAIQDHKRGILVGEKTFGKGSVQSLEQLSDGSELKVTIAHWFTPSGRAIHGKGLMPDIVVKMTTEDEKAGKDPQLDRAVEYLLSGK